MSEKFSQDIVDEVGTHRPSDHGLARVVVAGEFQAGKSSAINALLRQTIIPCNPGLPSRPLMKIVHSLEARIVAVDSEGRSHQVDAMEQLAGIDNIVQCDLAMPILGMFGKEIVEIPYRHGEGVSENDLEVMVNADLLIWVTIASQAWRLSEKAIVEKLGVPRDRSILAISRSDKLRCAEDLDKIETRLQKEASPYFSEMLFLHASTKKLVNARDDDRAWHETGGAVLASIVGQCQAPH